MDQNGSGKKKKQTRLIDFFSQLILFCVREEKEVNKIDLVCFAVSILENAEQPFSRFPFVIF
jgi:hypothetical protein